MNKEIKQQWLAALRSGEYEQGQEQLRSMDDKFCCLGVLCDLHAKATGNTWTEQEEDYNFSYEDFPEVLPSVVQEWAGLPANTGAALYATEAGFRELTALNDGGYTFEQLATLIEKQL